MEPGLPSAGSSSALPSARPIPPLCLDSRALSESTQPLANPYQGFYHIIRYTLSDDVPSGEAAIGADSYAHPLALLEINLKQFRTSAISENGLAQLNIILASWSRSPAHTRLILRFLYDWDGVAAAAEPESLTLVLTHMDQVAPVVNRYRDAVYLMQGIFIGNWGKCTTPAFRTTPLWKCSSGT